jgi:hypothetical protein
MQYKFRVETRRHIIPSSSEITMRGGEQRVSSSYVLSVNMRLRTERVFHASVSLLRRLDMWCIGRGLEDRPARHGDVPK